MTGIHLRSDTGGTIWMDGLSFSNSLTVEQNVLGPGVIAHILRNRTIDPSNYALADSWFHYDQVGSVMLASNASGTQQTAHYQDAWGNVLQSWQTGRWDGGASGWHHNTKATDGDSELVYMMARWYFSPTGAFLSRDPLDEVHEAYSFARHYPVAGTDPLGLFYWASSCCGSTGPQGLPGVLEGGRESTAAETENCKEVAGRITNPELRTCVEGKCDSATFHCKPNNSNLCRGRAVAEGPFGGNQIYLCTEKLRRYRDAFGPEFFWYVVVHELAHTCEWRHNTGGGVPFDDGYLPRLPGPRQ